MEGSESRGIRVVGPYTSSSLTLRALLKSAAGRLGMGAPARRVTGLTPPARAMHVAVAAGRTPFRLEDLLALTALMRDIRPPDGSERRRSHVK